MGLNLWGISSVIDSIHRILWSVLHLLGLLVGIIPKTGRFSRGTYIAIHYVFIVVALMLLAVYSTRLIEEAHVTLPYRFVRRYYVAIVFALVYSCVRLLIAAYYLYMTRDISEFDDINQAWEAGLDALAQEGFDLQWLPVFLINGTSAEQQKSIFEASRIPWKVKCSSDDPRFAVLSFHASDEALFISLNDVGAMSSQLKKSSSKTGTVAMTKSSPGIQATMLPGQISAAIQNAGRPEQGQNAGRTLPPGGVAAILGSTMPPGGAQMGGTMQPGALANLAGHESIPISPSAAPGVPGKLSKDELVYQSRRLDYFCQMLASERGSYCPLNGLLQVIPLRWTQSKSDSYKDLMEAIKVDLQTMHDGFHLQFPVVCMHAGLEELNGLKEFVERGNEINSRFKDSRAGSHFPSGLVIDDKSSSWVVERGLIWFRDWVYAEFAKNLANPNNRKLYQFLCSLAFASRSFGS